MVRQSQWMKSGRRGFSGRRSSTDKGFEVRTEMSVWVRCSKQVGR